jgi:polyisoprenoid-binding protein YceI
MTLLAIAFALQIGSEPPGSPGAFLLDVEPNHSTIGFSVPIVHGMTRVTGKFTDFSVTIRFHERNLAQCSVEVSIKAASVNTGIEARDADLRGPAFFAVRDHPLITFASSHVDKRTDGYVLHGPLSIRGVSHEIELPFKTTAIVWEDGRPRLGVAAQLSLNRLDFGVGNDWKHTAIPDFLGSSIAIEIFLWTKLGIKE